MWLDKIARACTVTKQTYYVTDETSRHQSTRYHLYLDISLNHIRCLKHHIILYFTQFSSQIHIQACALLNALVEYMCKAIYFSQLIVQSREHEINHL